MKKCSKCCKIKSLDEFYNAKRTKDGKTYKCKECNKKYYEEHKKETKKYREIHKEEKNKRDREKYYKKGVQSMHKNKDCASYLGVVVGERLCKHIFRDVKIMPINNHGYDIICNKGKKIDVKTSCLRNEKYPRWCFYINRNSIANFFILVAFDNRIDLTPFCMWMIPSCEINDKSTISISPPTIHKWDKWKRDIDDVQLCCNTMKKIKM